MNELEKLLKVLEVKSENAKKTMDLFASVGNYEVASKYKTEHETYEDVIFMLKYTSHLDYCYELYCKQQNK